MGLAARDTLRLEAGMPLYGHELSEQIHPLQAGLDFAVQLDQRDFIGRDALVLAQSDIDLSPPRGTAARRTDACRASTTRSCWTASIVGEVTSGTFSPTLDRPIAMAYVDPPAATSGQTLQVDIRGRTGAGRSRRPALLFS